jgi:hypothetical protein
MILGRKDSNNSRVGACLLKQLTTHIACIRILAEVAQELKERQQVERRAHLLEPDGVLDGSDHQEQGLLDRQDMVEC